MTLPNFPEEVLTERESRMIDTLLTPPRKQMPLKTFEKEFLPFLSSVPVPDEVIQAMLNRMSHQTKGKHTLADLTGNLINQWMEYHQSPGAPYLMVDVMVGDEVVYTVPPLLHNQEVLVEGVDARMLTSIANQSSNLSIIHPRLAGTYVEENLLPLIAKTENRPEYVDMWNAIYAYHGLPLIKLVDGKYVSTANIENRKATQINGATVEADGAISEMNEYD